MNTDTTDLRIVSGNPALFGIEKLQTKRIMNRHRITMLLKPSGVLVYRKNNGIISIVIGNDQPLPGRVEIEISRGLAYGRYMLNYSKQTGSTVDGKYGQAVMSAI